MASVLFLINPGNGDSLHGFPRGNFILRRRFGRFPRRFSVFGPRIMPPWSTSHWSWFVYSAALAPRAPAKKISNKQDRFILCPVSWHVRGQFLSKLQPPQFVHSHHCSSPMPAVSERRTWPSGRIFSKPVRHERSLGPGAHR